MSLDPTAREANVRDSIKKWAIDNIQTIEGITCTFDKGLSTPNIQGHDVTKWVAFHLGGMDRGYLSEALLEIYCCTRQDSEGFVLAQTVDKVLGYLDGTSYADGMGRIPFYRSRADGAWTLLGNLVVQDVYETGSLLAPDETKFKMITVRLRFASKF